MNKWQDKSLSLGERCVAFAENELANKVQEDKPKSYTSPRIREYFSIATRVINGKEVKMHVQAANWCAAGVSFCLYNSLLTNEKQPHGYRLGVVEIIADLQSNKRYKDVIDVRKKSKSIKVGDPVFFDRSDPKKPESSWWRHIGLVHTVLSDGFTCISGNSNGKWNISNHNINQTNLIGFGDYESSNQDFHLIDETENLPLEELAPKEDTGDNLGNFFGVYKDFHFK